MKPIFSLQNVKLDRGNAFTLWIEYLDVMAGGLYALTGPNGAGKSTLLRILSMLTLPETGDLHFAGRPIRGKISELKKLRRQITLVEQTPYLFDDSVFQNLAFGLRLRGIRSDEQSSRINQALEDVGLSGFEGRKAQELSGGEARRIALARALALKPKVLLLDEPTANVDEASVSVFETLLSTLPQRGMSIIFSTHDSSQPERLGAEVIRMREGRLENVPCSAFSRQHVAVKEKISWPQPLKIYESLHYLY
jgi:tungstate transport system ATP-binding protein